MERTRAGETRESRWQAQAMWVAIAALIALLHLFHNGIHIADRELRLDEGWTYYVAAHPLVSNLTLPISLHAQPPLYYVILHFLIAVNSEEWFLRGFSWVAMMGLLGFVLFFLSELNRLARVFFCTALVLHEFSRYLAQELRPYALAALTTFVATILLARLVRQPDRRAALAYGVVALVALYTLALDMFAFGCHGMFLASVVVCRSRAGWREALRGQLPSLLSVAGVALLYLPYVVVVWHWQSGVGTPSPSGSLHQMAHADYREAFRDLLGTAQVGLATWMAMAAFLLGVYGELRVGNWAVLMVAAIVVGHVVFVQGLLYGRGVVAPRYYAPAFVIFWFLVSLGFHHLVPHPRKLVWPVVLLALAYRTAALATPFFVNARQPLPRSEMRRLHDVLAAIPGRKVVLFDYGFRGQMLEYETRNDPAIVIRGKRQDFWAGFPEHILAETVEPEAVERWIEEETAANCFFYYVDQGPESPYFSVFVPAMARRGYREIAVTGSVHGFCRQP